MPSKLQTFSKDSCLGNSLCGGPLDSCPVNVNVRSERNGSGSNNNKKLFGGAIAGIAIGFVFGFSITSSNFDILCQKKSSNKKESTVDIAMMKHPSGDSWQEISEGAWEWRIWKWVFSGCCSSCDYDQDRESISKWWRGWC